MTVLVLGAPVTFKRLCSSVTCVKKAKCRCLLAVGRRQPVLLGGVGREETFFFSEYVLYSERWKELYVICWLILESSSRGPVCDVLCELALELLPPWDVASWTSAGNTDVHLLVCCRV